MTGIERARALLAAEYESLGDVFSANDIRTGDWDDWPELRAIARAIAEGKRDQEAITTRLIRYSSGLAWAIDQRLWEEVEIMHSCIRDLLPALSKREGAQHKPCTCSDETIARVNAGDICGMGGCPYGGDR